MIAQSIQFNRRNALSVLLAVFMLALMVTPALAWVDEGEVNGQAARPCHLIADGQDASALYCFQSMPQHERPLVEQPLVRPAVARGEQMFIPGQWLADSIALSASD